MDPACKNITKVILPAIRASVAEVLYKDHQYRQKEIADKLGVAQVAVSKYLNGRYSACISQTKNQILRGRLNGAIVKAITGGGTRSEIDREIDSLCDRLANFKAE
ncbi:Uncharacterised protein [uncultured archaeon]|nr:Uncharacterised protein [uncultured archaeon]